MAYLALCLRPPAGRPAFSFQLNLLFSWTFHAFCRWKWRYPCHFAEGAGPLRELYHGVWEKWCVRKRPMMGFFLLCGEFANQPEIKRRFSFSTCDQRAVVSDVQLVAMIRFQCPLWCLDTWVMTRPSPAAAALSAACWPPPLSGHPVDCILIRIMQLKLWRDVAVNCALFRKVLTISSLAQSPFLSVAAACRFIGDLGQNRPTAEACRSSTSSSTSSISTSTSPSAAVCSGLLQTFAER